MKQLRTLSVSSPSISWLFLVSLVTSAFSSEISFSLPPPPPPPAPGFAGGLSAPFVLLPAGEASSCFLVGGGVEGAAADTSATADDFDPLPPVPPMFCATYSRSSSILCTRKVFLPS